MKKNGFTLTELIGAIVILSVLIGISTAAYFTISNNIKKKLYEEKIELIKLQAIKYAEDNDIISKTINVATLIKDGYIGNDSGTYDDFKQYVNPINTTTDNKYLDCYLVYIVDKNGEYKVTIEESNTCTLDINELPPHNPCTYDGQLVEGAEYSDGTYTYRYKQERVRDEWISIEEDGWGVKLTNPATQRVVKSPLCTSINDKPIVSFSSIFYNAEQLSYIDVSSFNTKNVKRLSGMFDGAGRKVTSSFTIKGLENFDLTNVNSISHMFYEAGKSASTWDIGDLSKWNTSNITDMGLAFYGVGQNAQKVDFGNLSNFDTSKVTNMHFMFRGMGENKASYINLDLSSWDVSKVTDMEGMFAYTGTNASSWNVGNLSSWDTSNVEMMTHMFDNAGKNVSSWNSIGTLKIYANKIGYLFNYCLNAKATLNIYTKEIEINDNNTDNKQNHFFSHSATSEDALIIVNYSKNTTNLDQVLANYKTNDSKVEKGIQLD